MSARRYIPPALRNKPTTDTISEGTSVSDKQSNDELSNVIPRRLSDLQIADEDRKLLHTLNEIVSYYGGSELQSTLHDSSQLPGKLAYVILYRNANPRWYPDRIIFAKTNIDILPGYHDFKRELLGEQALVVDGTPMTESVPPVDLQTDTDQRETIQTNNDAEGGSQPGREGTDITNPEPAIGPEMLPIFMEIATRKSNLRRFVFHGYFRLMRVQFLKPNSPEVVRLLQQKWEPTQRNPNMPPPKVRERETEAWKKSMNQEWAVIKMTKVKDDELENVAEPDIKILMEDETQDKNNAQDIASENKLETSGNNNEI